MPKKLMPKSCLRLLSVPVYPWLIGVFPLLHLYAVNFGAVIDREVPICILWLMIATTIGFLAINAVLRNRHETALIVAFSILSFSLSGHVHTLLFERELLLIWTVAVVLFIAAAIAVLHRTRAAVDLAQAAIPMNLISAALILLQIATLAALQSETHSSQLAGSARESALEAMQSRPKIHDSAQRPDVYYIVPDGYPSDGWIQSTLEYDNSPFADALRARGFEVVSHAQSNYGTTLPSLASTLNTRYFDANPSTLHDVDYLRLSIADSEIAMYFQQLGYTYIQFLSGYLFPSSIADVNLDFTPNGTVDVRIDDDDLTVTLWDERERTETSASLRRLYQKSFISLYIETTLLKLIDDELRTLLEGYLIGPYDLNSPKRFLATIDEVEAVVSMPEATFTLIHLLKPHRPVVFDEDGDIIDKISKPSSSEYISELKFVNSKFIELIDTILAGSRHQPVIIFQADHGTTKGEVRRAGWRPIHFDVYSAYYIPDRYRLEIPKPHTNINTFPLILNAVFDAGLEYQENRLFELLKSNNKPFAQADVTEIFAHSARA